MIEDSEMRDLFRIESSEHIQAIEVGLLKLEKDPNNLPLLEELFRDAHSLKGASRMLELFDIERVFHRFEDILGKTKASGMPMPPETIDCMCRSLTAIRRLVDEAVTGIRANVVVSEVLDALLASFSAAESSAPYSAAPTIKSLEPHLGDEVFSPQIVAAPIVKPAVLEIIEEPAPKANTEPKVHAEQFVIETIRVETRKLDALMTHAGELTVAKIRIARRHLELEELQEKSDQIVLNLRNLGVKNSALDAQLAVFSSHLEGLISSAYEDRARLEFVTGELEEGIRSIRLLPLSTIFNLFGLMVRTLSRERDKEVALQIEGGEITADKRILEEIKDPLMHILRNAIDHGIESPAERLGKGKPAAGTIALRAYQSASNVTIEIDDDGQGLDLEAIKCTAKKSQQWRDEDLAAMSDEQIMGLIFMPGFSTSNIVSDVSGRGVGMDVVRANVEKLKGTVSVSSVAGVSCHIKIKLPLTVATTRVLIVLARGIKYAVPVEFVQKAYSLLKKNIFTVEGHSATMFEQQAVAVVRLHDLLQFRRTDFLPAFDESRRSDVSPCIIMEINGERFGLIVDELLDEQEIVLKSQSALLKCIDDISGVTILGTGEVCMVLNPLDFIAQLKQQKVQQLAENERVSVQKKQLILLAEDSLTTRAQMKRILESGGYETVLAVDGLDAYNKLDTRFFDAIVSDINMPNMDGLMLTKKVRSNKKYSDLPIILVTMLSTEEDKKRGLEAGANAYISKAAFDQKLLLDALKRLV